MIRIIVNKALLLHFQMKEDIKKKKKNVSELVRQAVQ